ncbi:hypothetical protein B2J93_8404 [Marssonina coronariae]|uniref:Uncharacterized protein n=1 Tax=Diplocarpon coronariae TaxID=2795749 RepID=A0A218Z912_9HELO|nr:hypothetical protein B2J93_8404 [Marssonina coronariae]
MSDFQCSFLGEVNAGFKGYCFDDYSRFLQKELEAEEAQRNLPANVFQESASRGIEQPDSSNASQYISLDEYDFDEYSANAWYKDRLEFGNLFSELDQDQTAFGDKQAAVFKPVAIQYPILAPVEHSYSDSDEDSDEDESVIEIFEASSRRIYSDKSPCWTKDDSLAQRSSVYSASNSEDETSDDDNLDEGDGADEDSICAYDTYSDGDIEPFPLYVEPFPEVESASNVGDCIVSLSERVKLSRRGQKSSLSPEIKKRYLEEDEDLSDSDSDSDPQFRPAAERFKSQPTKKALSNKKRVWDDDDDLSDPGCQPPALKKARTQPSNRSPPSKKRSRDDIVEVDCESIKPPKQKKGRGSKEPYVFVKVAAKGPVLGRPSVRSLPLPPIVQTSLMVGKGEWAHFERATLYYLLVEHRNLENREGLAPLKDEKLHRHMSNLMRIRYNIVRSPLGCRNWWNRHGRFETGWDERINGKGSLITSSQVKKSSKKSTLCRP